MRIWLLRKLAWLWRKLRPQSTPREVELSQHVSFLARELEEAVSDNRRYDVDAIERIAELIEARQMAGAGPWRVSPATITETDSLIDSAVESMRTGRKLRETGTPITAAGAFGDIELALQNIEWRREINLSWLEFSRWGIQQLMLISRLHFVKHPWIKRGVNLAAYYVFGRGIEISSPDERANEVLTEFLQRNSKTLGQVGLAMLEKRLHYDGQVFFVLFPDREDSGITTVRTIDATEIQDIITDPDDTDSPRYYHRVWSARKNDPISGAIETTSQNAWYPALNYTRDEMAENDDFGQRHINDIRWDSPVYHMRAGTGVSKWHFDVPIVYAALDWAKCGRKFLEAAMTTSQALAQIATTITTKGGQQAIEGIKQQLQTNVNSQPGNSLWDTNPTPVNASIFASGPGTKLEAFKTRGMGGDPSEVKEYRNMVACVMDIPPTWLGDMETSNLATATTLDRPTELGFLEKQERWRECLTTICTFVLRVSGGAPNGTFRESMRKNLRIVEAPRRHVAGIGWVYEASVPQADEVQIRVSFPAIREGDIPELIKSVVDAMTLGNRGGQITGIDEKTGVRRLYELIGVEEADEIVEEMYPKGKYTMDRSEQVLAAPQTSPQPAGTPKLQQEADRAVRKLFRAIKAYEAAHPDSNGDHAEHLHTR